MAEHIESMLHALDRLEQHGSAFPERRITVLTREDTAALGDRIVAMLGDASSREPSSNSPTTTKACGFRYLRVQAKEPTLRSSTAAHSTG